MKKLLIALVGADILDAFLSYPKRELGAEIVFYRNDGELRVQVEAKQPDVMLLDMAASMSQIPRPDTLRWIRDRCRLVQVCFDASDLGWKPYLEMLKRLDATDLCIAADSATDWPHRDKDLSFPTPVDPWFYSNSIQCRECKRDVRHLIGEDKYGGCIWCGSFNTVADGTPTRTIKLGFSGSYVPNPPTPRKALLDALEGLVTIRRRQGSPPAPYADHAAFYRSCHAVVNDAHTSYGQLQCKARVIEAALAGCLVFETAGSPTAQWLDRWIDYIPYDTTDDIKKLMVGSSEETFQSLCNDFGQRAREKVLSLKLPERFWEAVLGD